MLWQGLHSLRSLGDTDPQVPIEFVIYSGDPDISFNDAKAAVLVRARALWPRCAVFPDMWAPLAAPAVPYLCDACRVQKRFGIDLSESGSAATIKFVYVTRRRLLEASK